MLLRTGPRDDQNTHACSACLPLSIYLDLTPQQVLDHLTTGDIRSPPDIGEIKC